MKAERVRMMAMNVLGRLGEQTLNQMTFESQRFFRVLDGTEASLPNKREVQNALRALQRGGEVRCFRYRGKSVRDNGKYLWQVV